MWNPSIIVVVCTVVGIAHAEDRWVWGTSNPEAKARKIPGFVPTTPEPPITTFRPSLHLPVGRGASTPSLFHNRLPGHHPFIPESFSPFDLVPSDVPKIEDDGTTKSRVTVDTAALDNSSGATLTQDKYTTLDRLQRERGPAPTFPPPQRHQLGGLHPDEVFYADDDLLIIRGGGFTSDAFREPSQPLDDSEGEGIEESTRVVSSLPPPSTDQEYNGNIPVIIPPPPSPSKDNEGSLPIAHPHQIRPSPFSIFVGGSSNRDYIMVPFVQAASPQASELGNGFDTITHNRLNTHGSQTGAKLRRAASTIVPYVYTPTHHVRVRPTVQRKTPVQNHVSVLRHQPVVQQSHVQVHQQRVIPSHFVVQQHQPIVRQQHHAPIQQQREPLLQYQTVYHQPQFVPHDFTHAVVKPVQTQSHPELEIQPDNPPILHSLEGDTDVNFLHPFPSQNPDAEFFVPSGRRPTYVHTNSQSHRPRV